MMASARGCRLTRTLIVPRSTLMHNLPKYSAIYGCTRTRNANDENYTMWAKYNTPNYRIDKLTKELKFIPNTYGDRFIPRRYPTLAKYANQMSCTRKAADRIDILQMRKRIGYWRCHNFKVALDSCFEMRKNSRVLCLTDTTNRKIAKDHNYIEKSIVLQPKYSNIMEQDWSCKPRNRPATFLESVHDMPNFKKHLFDVIDWSVKGQIAALFDTKILFWSPKTEVSNAFDVSNVSAIKFNTAGTKLASIYGETGNGIDIWDTQNGFEKKRYRIHSLKYNQITCIAWDKEDKVIICGSMSGNLYVVLVSTMQIWQVLKPPKIEDMVIKIKFSANGNYVVSIDNFGQATFWMWDKAKLRLAQHSVWVGQSCDIVFDFHPWIDGELIIAESNPPKLHLVRIPTREIIAYYRIKNNNCCITQISFNKVSAELLVAFCCDNADAEKCFNEVLVLASMDRIVDILRNPDAPILHIIWSPGGQMLGTVDDDESFSIWNFFGKVKRRITRKDPRNRRSPFFQALR